MYKYITHKYTILLIVVIVVYIIVKYNNYVDIIARFAPS